jgi:hypothetical protein
MTLDVPEEPPSPDVSTGLEVRIAIQDVVDADFIDKAVGPVRPNLSSSDGAAERPSSRESG